MTMTLVSTATVGAGGAASIEWTGIPATGTDLLIVTSLRSTGNSVARLTFNATGTTYTERILQGDGGTASSFTETNFAGHIVPSTHTASTFGNSTIYIPNYAGSTAKSFSIDSVSENNATTAYQNLIAGSWNGTGSITSISITASNLAQYSTASLYTITKGSGGATVA